MATSRYIERRTERPEGAKELAGAPSDREAGIRPSSERDKARMRPNVVALGGGHGLSVALRAIREYAGEITAIVSVADDGGSSGRLRRDLDVPAPGDLRRCLVALASEDGPWPAAFEHRFGWGELAGHALGNLMLVGLAATLGDLTAALDEAGRVLGAVGRVLPATTAPVSMTAEVGGERVIGQVAIAHAGEQERIRDVRLEPADASVPADALERARDGRSDRHRARIAVHQHRGRAVCSGTARRRRARQRHGGPGREPRDRERNQDA